MSQGSDAAEQMVKETMIISETAAKLAGLGAKNLAVLLTLYLREEHPLKGETNLKKLLKEGKEIRVFCLDKDNLAEFKKHAKDYGIVYSSLKQTNDESNIIDVLVKAEDTPRVNRILEKMKYPLPEDEKISEKIKADEQTKKSVSAARSEKASNEPSIGSAMPTKNDERRSVKDRIDELEAFKNRAQEKYKVRTASKEIKREKRQER